MIDVSSPLPSRTELIEALSQVGRELSTATVLFHTAMAEQFRLSTTDWKCADLVARMGPLTAGQLAELTGLTTGAITGVIDRLEQAGFARRDRDPQDRRKVIIQPIPEREEEATAYFETLRQGYSELLASYSDQELAFILEYLTQSIAVMQEATNRLRSEARVVKETQ